MCDRDGSTVPGCVDSDPRVFDTEGLRVINAPGMPFEGCIPDLHPFRHKRMLRPSAINAWSPGRFTVLNPASRRGSVARGADHCQRNKRRTDHSAPVEQDRLVRALLIPRCHSVNTCRCCAQACPHPQASSLLTPDPCSLLTIHFLLTFALHLRDMPLSGRLYGSYTVQPTRVGQERGIANEEHANYPGASGKSPVLH